MTRVTAAFTLASAAFVALTGCSSHPSASATASSPPSASSAPSEPSATLAIPSVAASAVATPANPVGATDPDAAPSAMPTDAVAFCSVYYSELKDGQNPIVPSSGNYEAYLTSLLKLQPLAPASISADLAAVIAGTRVLVGNGGQLSQVGSSYFMAQQNVIVAIQKYCGTPG